MAESLTSEVVTKCFTVIVEFLESKYTRDKVSFKINSFSLQPGCGAGENFLGAIFACKFSVTLSTPPSEKEKERKKTRKDFDIILKSQLLSDSNSASKYFWNIMFTKEKMIYDIVAKLEEMGHVRLCPKMHHFFSEGEDYACLVLDNLISMGYYIPKSTNLTLDECTIIVKHLARLHSLSLVLEAKNALPIPESYEFCAAEAELFFSSGMEHIFRPYVQQSFNGIVQACEKIRPDLVGRLKKFNQDETVWQRACGFVKPGKTSFNCICHGDSRLGNIFLKKKKKKTTSNSFIGEEGEEEEEEGEENTLRFIDFQLTRYASPISDLVYTMYVGSSKNFRDRHLTTLLKIYYDEFRAVLHRFSPQTKLNTVQPQVMDWSLEKLNEEFRQFDSYAVIVAIVFLPVVLLRPSDLDSSVADMTYDEREEFMVSHRADIISKVLPDNPEMRDRILETFDEFL